MLPGFQTIRLNEPNVIVITFLSFVVAVTIHEFMHAWTANRLGDPTARNLGRITLNPLMHFDPFGLLGLALISLGVPFIGWGKPVPVNTNNLGRDIVARNRGMAIIALAGPVSNVAQAVVAGLVYTVLRQGGALSPDVALVFERFIFVNALLAAFNMIPVPPLDGSRILLALLPPFWYPVLAPIERYGFVALILLIFVGGGSIVSGITGPVYDLVIRLSNLA
jgi:Zn-dependent protease